MKGIVESSNLLPDLFNKVKLKNFINCIVNDLFDHSMDYKIELVIDISKFSNVDKLFRITSRIFNLFKGKSSHSISISSTVNQLRCSEKFWINEAQKDLGSNWKRRYERLGPMCNDDGMIIVGSRLKNWLQDNWNQSEFILLTPNHLNWRPIGIIPGDDLSLGTYLCFNDLFLAHNNIRVPNKTFEKSDVLTKRYQFINPFVHSLVFIVPIEEQ